MKKGENEQSLRNTVRMLDETLNGNDIVRMHDDQTGGNEQETVNMVRMPEDSDVKAIVRMHDDQTDKHERMRMNPVRMSEEDNNPNHDETLSEDDTVRMYDVKIGGNEQLLVRKHKDINVENKMKMPDETMNGNCIVRMHDVQTGGNELLMLNMVRMPEDSNVEPIVRMHGAQTDKHEKLRVNPVTMPKESEMVKLERMHDAEYRNRNSEKTSIIRMRMYKGQTGKIDLWNSVRMYNALKHKGWMTWDGKTSENETLNKVRMHDTKCECRMYKMREKIIREWHSPVKKKKFQ